MLMEINISSLSHHIVLSITRYVDLIYRISSIGMYLCISKKGILIIIEIVEFPGGGKPRRSKQTGN